MLRPLAWIKCFGLGQQRPLAECEGVENGNGSSLYNNSTHDSYKSFRAVPRVVFATAAAFLPA